MNKFFRNWLIPIIILFIVIIRFINSNNIYDDNRNYEDNYISEEYNKNDKANEKKSESFFEKLKNEFMKMKPESNEDYDDEKLENERIMSLQIKKTFSNGQSFNCQKVKNIFYTGYKAEKINPEDIDIVAAMGDSLSSGLGLWQNSKIEFRGAVFTVGGDSYLEGLVTIPAILQLFNQNLLGESHGMGDHKKLPIHQFNVAVSESQTDDLEFQANELVSRILKVFDKIDLEKKWILIFITTGTEETCYRCDPPSIHHIRKAIKILRKQLPKILVVLIGPLYVAPTIKPQFNILKIRCPCLRKMNEGDYIKLMNKWKESFEEYERDTALLRFKNFGIIGIPRLEIISNNPEYYLIKGQPLLNRKGHSYAAKWLWNRLIAGKSYNSTYHPVEKDSYYCPPLECPYFKIITNEIDCKVETLKEHQEHIDEAKRRNIMLHENDTLNDLYHYGRLTKTQKMIRNNFIIFISILIIISFISVFIVGREIYKKGKKDDSLCLLIANNIIKYNMLHFLLYNKLQNIIIITFQEIVQTVLCQYIIIKNNYNVINIFNG
uniref:Lipase_GDSL domain-containing protein n=1 Tax=Parastrongyloides trichosuri TaxID=131310 RepID=A0A0N4Z228_PARTI